MATLKTGKTTVDYSHLKNKKTNLAPLDQFISPGGNTPIKKPVSLGEKITPSTKAQPKVGGMSLNKFTQLTGGLAHAISPNTMGGRVGNFMSQYAGQELARTSATEAANLKEINRVNALKEDRDYKAGVLAKQNAYEESQSAYNLTKKRLGGKTNPKTGKPYTTAEIIQVSQKKYPKPTVAKPKNVGQLKLEKGQDFDSLSASIASLGGEWDTDSRSFIVPSDEAGNVDPAILEAFRGGRFGIKESADVSKTDKPYWFTGDNYSKTFYLGGHMPGAKGGKTPPVKKKKKSLSEIYK